jgi:hypothetical protein
MYDLNDFNTFFLKIIDILNDIKAINDKEKEKEIPFNGLYFTRIYEN